jgi:hypothetical protein
MNYFYIPPIPWKTVIDGNRTLYLNPFTTERRVDAPPGTTDVRTLRLPPPWVIAQSTSKNRPFFFNPDINTSSWTIPRGTLESSMAIDAPVERVAKRTRVSNFRRQKLTPRMRKVLRRKKRVGINDTLHYKLVSTHYPELPIMERDESWSSARHTGESVLHTSPDRQPRLSPDSPKTRRFSAESPPSPLPLLDKEAKLAKASVNKAYRAEILAKLN